MKTLFKSWIVRVLVLVFAASAAFAQDRVAFRQEELDQMLAPIALYPDSLLSQLLMASTYPLEVVQAARWSRANRGLKGQQAVKAVEGMDWDPSVKSLTAFPEVLTQLDEKLDWTERLGEAFLAQQQDVMDTVQELRRRADATGNLQSNERMRVVREPDHIVIEPPATEVVYVPHYSPAVVYGPWWYPAYPPVYWAPPPAYYAVPAYGPAFFWGPAIGFSAGFFFGHFDWHHRHATVVQNNITNVYVNRRTVVNRSDAIADRRTAWRHDPAHRRGVPFRTAAARERFDEARAEQRRGGERADGAARGERRAENTRTADLRQSRVDERRNGTPERRDDRGQAAAAGRQSLTDDGNRAERARAAQAGARAGQPEPRRGQAEGRSSSSETKAASSDARGGQQDTRSGQPERQSRPEPRNAQPDRDSRPARSERAAPQSGDRRGDSGNVTRLQARSAESRTGVRAELQRRAQAPSARFAERPTVAQRRAQPQGGGHVRAAPQQRHFAAEGSAAPRASAGASAPQSHAQPRGNTARQGSGGRGGRS